MGLGIVLRVAAIVQFMRGIAVKTTEGLVKATRPDFIYNIVLAEYFYGIGP